MYTEIYELFLYCKKEGINAKFENLFDGYVILFPNGGDVIQHFGSYGSNCGCVEPAIGCRLDYTAVSLNKAKRLIRRYKKVLNQEE
jgi:hypothetical protein